MSVCVAAQMCFARTRSTDEQTAARVGAAIAWEVAERAKDGVGAVRRRRK